MRRRTGSDSHASEVARRRLEALSRELGLEGSGAVTSAPERRDERTTAPPAAVAVPVQDDVHPARPGGRHALPRLDWRERLDLWTSDRLPSGGARQFGSAHLAVVGVIVAASLAVGAWQLVRASAEPERVPVAPPALTEPGSPTEAAAGSPTPGAATASPTASGEIVVDVVGRVREPGIAVLEAGSRVVDALKAAGGLRRGARPDGLNLARPLVDGEQIVVGRAAVPPAAVAPGAAPTAGSSSAGPPALVNLNTADAAALDTLPGVGPVTAAAILEWREQNGGFTAVEELLEVSGIGEATLAEIAPHVTV